MDQPQVARIEAYLIRKTGVGNRCRHNRPRPNRKRRYRSPLPQSSTDSEARMFVKHW